MAEADDLTTMSPENSSFTTSDGREIAGFECNICFELAQDPVITLCGHLHCWPCLYKWLKLHSHSHECPVCKTRIEDEKLIPLYGRGKTTTDPRFSPPEIPHRPAGQRPETAPTPPPEANNLTDTVLGRIGGVIPMAPAAFSVRFHEFSDAIGYGGSWGFQHGYTGSFGEDGLNRESSLVARGINDDNLKKILVFILLFVLFDFLTF